MMKREEKFMRCDRNPQAGFALIGTLLFLVLLSALAVTLTYTVRTEKRIGGSDQEGNLAYYDAEAGMEKMTADLGSLYVKNQSPSAQQIIDLGKDKPALPDVGYKYDLLVAKNADGSPVSRVQTVSSGDEAGLSALIIPITLDVTATRVSGAQVHLTRQVEVAQIPVFQFGVFSDTDLSYHAGPNFDFAGRVHTNGNLFLAQGSGATLTFHDKITVAKEIVRQQLVNGVSTTPNYTGTVDVPTAPNGCPGGACRALALTEGSVQGGPLSAATPNWTSFSLTKYNCMLRNQVKPLNLPFVQSGVSPIEIIREPLPNEDPGSTLGVSRLYNEAQIRVLLADTQADLPDKPQPGDILLDAPGGCFPVTGAGTTCAATANDAVDPNWKRPAGATGDWSLLGGWLRVEARQTDGTYKNVTQEWLDLGFARGVKTPDAEHGRANTVNPNAILIFQQLKDTINRGVADSNNTNLRYNWFPINFYDTREGEFRDIAAGGTTCSAGGVMNAVELDVLNLRQWLTGKTGTTGTSVESASQNGYILYYADHRGMLADPALPTAVKHGDYGFEDFLNPNDPAGAPNGVSDAGEDVNEDGALQTYGASNLGRGFGLPDGDPRFNLDCDKVGRRNRVSGARHAFLVLNGSLGNLPSNFAKGTGGFTVAGEQPVYIVGNYNANDAGWGGAGNAHVSAAVIADTVSLLSNNWTNTMSMQSPRSQGNAVCSAATLADPSAAKIGRQACTTWYRVAIATGKSIPFPHPGWSTVNDFGTDGGVHNFLRYLENWGGQSSNYQGSLVSLYNSRYGVGVFKCCTIVYSPPQRNYSFDTDFLDPSKMPPGTPRFIDVVNVDVVQDFKPR
jgi:type IV pilus assembly PilX-like protein